MGLLSRRRARHHSDHRYHFGPDGKNIATAKSKLKAQDRHFCRLKSVRSRQINRFKCASSSLWNAVCENKIHARPIAPEYKEADRRSGPNQENTEHARAGVTGHNVRYVLSFGLLAVIIAGRRACRVGCAQRLFRYLTRLVRNHEPATIYLLIDVGRKDREINGLSVPECDWPSLGANLPC